MNFSHLNDLDLVQETKKLVGEEKRTTEKILENLSEIERRRVNSKRGFSSLFDFCTKELGYSESSAQRPIASMRLLRTLPEARASLGAGKVNLSTLSQLQTFIKREEIFKKVMLNHSQKLELLGAIENKSQRDCEKVFVERSPEVVSKAKESSRPLTSALSEIKFMASKELVAKLAELKNLLAHQNKSNSTAELVEILADTALKKLKTNSTAAAAVDFAGVTLSEGKASKSIAGVRRAVWARDSGQCQKGWV